MVCFLDFKHHILETRLYTNYISYIQASQLIIMPYVECDLEKVKDQLLVPEQSRTVFEKYNF